MALGFAIGSACFLVAPFPGYLDLVGPTAAAVTFFVGSVFFTVAGALQTWLAVPGRRQRGAGRAAWWAAAVQSLGTLWFNVTTFRALHTALTSPRYDALVWRPDALGSVGFLVSGVIAYRASARRGWLPARATTGWWQPGVNGLGLRRPVGRRPTPPCRTRGGHRGPSPAPGRRTPRSAGTARPAA
jgi:hypothetical protein